MGEDEARFMRAVSDAIRADSTARRRLASEFGATLATVDRWANGTAAPHPLLRTHVYQYLEDMRNLGGTVRSRHKNTNTVAMDCDADLDALIEQARNAPPMTEEERAEQAASWAYGQMACMDKYKDATPEQLAVLRRICRKAAGLR